MIFSDFYAVACFIIFLSLWFPMLQIFRMIFMKSMNIEVFDLLEKSIRLLPCPNRSVWCFWTSWKSHGKQLKNIKEYIFSPSSDFYFYILSRTWRIGIAICVLYNLNSHLPRAKSINIEVFDRLKSQFHFFHVRIDPCGASEPPDWSTQKPSQKTQKHWRIHLLIKELFFLYLPGMWLCRGVVGSRFHAQCLANRIIARV